MIILFLERLIIFNLIRVKLNILIFLIYMCYFILIEFEFWWILLIL